MKVGELVILYSVTFETYPFYSVHLCPFSRYFLV